MKLIFFFNLFLLISFQTVSSISLGANICTYKDESYSLIFLSPLSLHHLQLLILALYHYEPGYKDESYSLIFLSLPPHHLQLLILTLYHYEPGYKDESYSLIFLSSLPPQHLQLLILALYHFLLQLHLPLPCIIYFIALQFTLQCK